MPAASAPPDSLARAVFDALAEGVVWQAADGRVIDANAAAAPILGLTRDELLGRSSRDPRWAAIHEDGTPWPGELHPAMLALRTGAAQRDQLMGVLAPRLGRRWIRIHSVPLQAAGEPAPTGVVTSFADVTEPVELRRRLQEANAELADLYDHAPCGYHMLDRAGRYLRINATALAWLGCPRDELIGKLGPLDFTDAAGRALFASHFPRIRAGEPIEGLEFDLHGRHGVVRRVRVSASPVFDADGQFAATRSVLVDVTELAQGRARLERLAAQQAAMLDNDLVGIVRLRDRTIEWKNRAFDRILGYASDELLGRETEQLYLDEGGFRRLGELAYPVLREGGTYRAQLELRRKDGRTVWVDSSGVMPDPASGESIWFSKDVTEQHRAEELRLQAARLEAENRQLVETGRLQKAFLANMSHELRTPLNAILGFAQLLTWQRTPPDGAAQRGYAERIETSARQLLGMIEALLDVTAAERGHLRFQGAPVDLPATVDEVIAMLEPKWAPRGIQVRLEPPAGATTAELDPLRLRQVLTSVLDNAIKFSHDGGTVDVRLRDAPPGRFVIEVEDRGIGMSAAQQAQAFGRFYQASTGDTKAYEGTGAGLALVKLLVEAQGGRVGVRSEPGRGSVFELELPRAFSSPAA